jgi:hypothetical protein
MLGAALVLVVPVVSALAAEKEDPAKFKYRNLPVEASCLDGYHPTIDAEGNKVFPCVANAESVVSTEGTIKGKTGSAK